MRRTLRADATARAQAILQGIVAEAPLFSAGSDCAVMAAMDVLASKYPRRLLTLVSADAAMRYLATFYVTKVTERALTPFMAVSHHEKTPANTEVRGRRLCRHTRA